MCNPKENKEGLCTSSEDIIRLIMMMKMTFFVLDEDKNDALNRTEFAAFLHPEEHTGMRDIVVLETMEDVDKDKVKIPCTGRKLFKQTFVCLPE
jgi:hypothetical protein